MTTVPLSEVSTYERLYESHARALPPELSIGDGDFAHMGELMLSALCAHGLEPHHTLVDLGCGTGRLAVPAVQYLERGAYVGIDISETMLAEARRRVGEVAVNRCDVSWRRQADAVFEMEPATVDAFAAFSVFTHMEHEDTYRYLAGARRVTKPGGMFVFSCLTMDLAAAQQVFLTSAQHSLDLRWEAVRNVTTTYDLMDSVAALAGWHVDRWYKGDEELIPLRNEPGRFAALGQSISVLR